MGLKQMALAELEQVDAANREREEKVATASRKHQIEVVLQMLAISAIDPATALIDEERGIVTVDGVRFLGNCILGACPRCGEETPSNRVHSLYEIGQLISNFQPHYEHFCRQTAAPAERPPETAADRLVTALREFISGHYRGEWG